MWPPVARLRLHKSPTQERLTCRLLHVWDRERQGTWRCVLARHRERGSANSADRFAPEELSRAQEQKYPHSAHHAGASSRDG
jgi:hypothetical protein